MKKFIRAVTLYGAICFILNVNYSSAQEKTDTVNENEIAGEIFGLPVPIGNYYFAKRTLGVFGAKWSADPKTPQEIEDLVWLNLVLSYEAFRRGIDVTQQELEEEITKTLKGEKVDFNWRDNKEAYDKWLKEAVNENSELFANQLKYLMQIQKLRQQVLDGITPEVTEDQAYQEFCNEYNTLELELAQFDDLKGAQDFYKKAKANAKFWDKQVEADQQVENNQKLFRRPGFVALEFLMDMWQLPKDDLYKMLNLKPGSIYPAIPIYGGKYASVRVLKVRKAEKSEFLKLRASYFEQVKMKKKYEGLAQWIKKFKEEANIKVYLKDDSGSKDTKDNTQKEENKK